MEYLSSFILGKKKQPEAATATAPRIAIPRGNGMEHVEFMPVPQSGMDRAEWWGAAINGLPTAGSSKDRAAVCSYDRANVFGANERTAMGNTREDMIGAMTISQHNNFMWDDETTKQADAVPDSYTAQATSTDGFWDGERDMVWVSEDVTTVWN